MRTRYVGQWLLLFSSSLSVVTGRRERGLSLTNSTLSSLQQPCAMTSSVLVDVDASVVVDPCLVHNIEPTLEETTTSVVTIVSVTDSRCGIHRDGGYVAVQQLNRNAKLGHFRNHSVKFRFVAAIAGNSRQLGPQAYVDAHQAVLRDMLETYQPDFILGTCSFWADLEKDLSRQYGTMLFAQVGPNSFYTENSHKWIFGVHIKSEGYGIPALQALRLATPREQRPKQPVRIVYRDRSEFFSSTCEAVVERALADGFTDTVAIEYNPQADHNDNGILNEADQDFLHQLADQTCDATGVAIWACVFQDDELNTMLDRWAATGCRPSSIWSTVASWAWPHKYPERRPYLQSGAQWHREMQYSDQYFPNGQAMLDHLQETLDYPLPPDYGALGAYHGIMLMYETIRSYFKSVDVPNVEEVLSERYEELRRELFDLSLPSSLYGPTLFDERQRNVGRGAAGMQWLPLNESDKSSDTSTFDMKLISPIDQATRGVAVPAPIVQDCPMGSFVNGTRIAMDAALLTQKCSDCPVDMFLDSVNQASACRPCAPGSSTLDTTGATVCMAYEENLVGNGILVFGYLAMSLVFVVAGGSIAWTIRHRNDPIVQIGQIEFLLLICVGSIISSSSIIPLSIQVQAPPGDDSELMASRACTVLPWLYSTGWMLQYGSISAKSFRMWKITRNSHSFRRQTVSAQDMYKVVAGLVLLNWAIVIPWTIIDPLQWERKHIGTTVDEMGGVLTEESYGQCLCNNFFAWVGPLIALQGSVMILTNFMLYRLRHVSDRYQESTYVGLASAYACEFLLVGIPVLVAVHDSTESTYFVLVCIVALSDVGILLMIFVPKMRFRQQGLPLGLSVAQSILKSRALKAELESRSDQMLGRSSLFSMPIDSKKCEVANCPCAFHRTADCPETWNTPPVRGEPKPVEHEYPSLGKDSSEMVDVPETSKPTEVEESLRLDERPDSHEPSECALETNKSKEAGELPLDGG